MACTKGCSYKSRPRIHTLDTKSLAKTVSGQFQYMQRSAQIRSTKSDAVLPYGFAAASAALRNSGDNHAYSGLEQIGIYDPSAKKEKDSLGGLVQSPGPQYGLMNAKLRLMGQNRRNPERSNNRMYGLANALMKLAGAVEQKGKYAYKGDAKNYDDYCAKTEPKNRKTSKSELEKKVDDPRAKGADDKEYNHWKTEKGKPKEKASYAEIIKLKPYKTTRLAA